MRIAFFLAASLCAQQFRPVEPELLSLSRPKVDAGAGAEAVFWEVTMEEGPPVQLDHYVRVKIFNESGRERFGRVDLIISNGNSISQIEGRTIRTNGSIVPLDRGAIFEREVVKTNKLKVKVWSFAMPAIELGAVIEYKWREKRKGDSFHYERIDLQRELPVWSVKYRLKPGASTLPLSFLSFHAQSARFGPDEQKGFYKVTAENMHAFEEEPQAPPDDSIRSWILLHYQVPPGMNYLAHIQSEFLDKTKPDGAIKKLAAELTGGEPDPQRKLDILTEYCRTRIRNITYDPNSSPADRERAGKIKDAGDALAARMGDGSHINLLFAALARAAGFQPFLAQAPERSRMLGSDHEAFRTATNIAIKQGTEFRFFDPASRFVETGMLRWQEEGVMAVFAEGTFEHRIPTQWSGAERSRIERTAKLTLAADGSVEGSAQVVYHGHPGAGLKLAWFGKNTTETHEEVRQEVASQLPNATVEGIAVENSNDPTKPLTVRYSVRVPYFATRAGGRLFLPAAYFQRGLRPRFETSRRKNPIYFPYAWSEKDEVTWNLAPGLRLESPHLAPDLTVGKTGAYHAGIHWERGSPTFRYERTFSFVRDGMILYGVEFHPSLKNAFEAVHTRDNSLLEVRIARPQENAQ